MRLIHTSDWHLGKRLCDVSLLEDQAHALDQLFLLLKDERPDALVIAGDIYDRGVPPEEAVALFSRFLSRVSRDLTTTVVAISGNHDSPERLGFGAEILERGRVHLRKSLARRADPVLIETRKTRTAIYCLPYADPDSVRCALSHPGDESIRTHDAAVRAALVDVRAHHALLRPTHSVLVAHLFARGGMESEDSERPLIVGGAAHVAADALDGFGYVALGHLHAPQRVGGRDDVRYSGSLLKYSFGESNQKKGVHLVEFLMGRATVRTIELSARRDLARIEGSFDALLEDERYTHAEASYVEATYTDSTYLIDVAARLRRRFPHLLLALPARIMREPTHDSIAALDLQRDTRDLLAGFWQHVTGEPTLDPAHFEVFESALDAVSRSEAAGTASGAKSGTGSGEGMSGAA